LVGVATGAASGIDVLDLDRKHPEARAWWTANRSRLQNERRAAVSVPAREQRMSDLPHTPVDAGGFVKNALGAKPQLMVHTGDLPATARGLRDLLGTCEYLFERDVPVKPRNITVISVIVGSARQACFSEKPARWIFQHLQNRDGIVC
jgi:hypothetical protein